MIKRLISFHRFLLDFIILLYNIVIYYTIYMLRMDKNSLLF